MRWSWWCPYFCNLAKYWLIYIRMKMDLIFWLMLVALYASPPITVYLTPTNFKNAILWWHLQIATDSKHNQEAVAASPLYSAHYLLDAGGVNILLPSMVLVWSSATGGTGWYPLSLTSLFFDVRYGFDWCSRWLRQTAFLLEMVSEEKS